MYNKTNVIRHQEERVCINCGKTWKMWVRKHYISDRVQCFCDVCNKSLSYKEKHKIRMSKDLEYREKILEQKREDYKKHIIHYMWVRAKQRAEKYGYEFNIEESDIIIPSICPILEVPIVLGSKDNYEYTPSLDRIDNSKGYIKGNIQIISKKANSMKNSASLKELRCFCKNILRYSLNITEEECNEQQDKEPAG